MSGTALKFLMMFLMVLDHIPFFIPHELWVFFNIISRCVAPFFAYMTVEGFIHTRSRPAYIKRLFFWATLMLAGNIVLNYLVIKNENYLIKNSIIMTFAFSILYLYLCENGENLKKIPKAILFIFKTAIAVFLIISIDGFPEGSIIIFPIILITYYYKDNHLKRNLFYCGLSVLMLLIQINAAESYMEIVEGPAFFFISFLPFVYLYNGKRGKINKFTKYVFYVFYPVHVWIITIIAWQLGLPKGGI